ncbi:MAG: hypothetical protein QM396_03175 [Euryarchaeota archaeon]|jgi:predicted house-cleaning noncanonical NTP pyrophosphatase (MazG superfamily)|nr:hypothetical protein [Euryarchaeota archaeon]
MMDLKIRLGNKLLGEITEYLEGLQLDEPEHRAHQIMHIIARNQAQRDD